VTLSVEQIADVIASKRELHPELARALTWPGFLRICGREGVEVRVRKAPTARPAQLVPFLGEWTIIISADTPFRRHTYLGAHELGHLWLHHDRTSERWERVYNMDVHWSNDPREDEAELFASLVLMGPTRARPFIPIPEQETALQHALRTVRRKHHRPR
jgi:hypothetical protein